MAGTDDTRRTDEGSPAVQPDGPTDPSDASATPDDDAPDDTLATGRASGEREEPSGLPAPDPATGVAGTDGSADAVDAVTGPALPESEPAAPPPMADPLTRPTRPTPAISHYRSDHERARSVRRRANPWYRRLARGLIFLSIVTLLGVGIYYGIRALQDYIERDRLPEQAVDVPEFKSTTFQIRSSPAAPNLDGTLTVDVRTQAYEYVGRPAGAHSGMLVVRPTRSGDVFIRAGNEPWRRARPDDPVADELDRAIPYLVDVDNVDVLLPRELRRGYVDLARQVTEGTGDNELIRYEVTIDTREFSDDYPLQWQQFEDRAIPGVAEESNLPVTFWLDTEDVVVRLRDAETNWAWQRLAYSDTSFEPMDPSAIVVEPVDAEGDSTQTPVTTEPTDG